MIVLYIFKTVCLVSSSEMKKITSILLLLLFVSFSACHKDDEPRYDGPVEKTILVYLAANSTLASYALDDIQEMIAGMAGIDDDRYKLVILQATGGNPQLFQLAKDRKGQVYKEIINEYDKQNSVDTGFMTTVFADAFSACPAESYALVLWSHADGWLEEIPSTRYAATDGGNVMNIFELKKVLDTAPHFEYIYFESCFMSSVEVLYELRGYADYFVACPAETPGPGAPYHLILEDMYAKENAPEKLAKTYFAHYLGQYTGQRPTNSAWTSGAALAVVKSSALEELTAATAAILGQYGYQPIDRSGLLCYDVGTCNKLYYDMDEVIKRLTGGNAGYPAWRAAFDKAVVFYNTTDILYSVHVSYPGLFPMKGTQGLSFYLPRDGQEALLSSYRKYQWYTAGGWNAAGW